MACATNEMLGDWTEMLYVFSWTKGEVSEMACDTNEIACDTN